MIVVKIVHVRVVGSVVRIAAFAGAAAVEVDDYVIRDLLSVEDVVRHVAHAARVRDGVDGRGGSARFRSVVAVGGGYPYVGAACLHDCGVALARACKVVVQERELNAFALHDGGLSGLVVVCAGSAGLDAVLVEVFHGIEYAVGALVKAMVSAYGGYVESGVLESAQILHVRRRRGMRLHVAPARPVGVRIFHVADGDISGPEQVLAGIEVLFRFRRIQDDVSYAQYRYFFTHRSYLLS